MLVAIAIIAITWVFYTTAQIGGRAFILGIATTLALGVPVLLARRTLTATAETIAGLGLLLVLLDGYAAYSSDLAGLASVPTSLYAAILFGLVAGVASAYRLATHLRAPQFAALLAAQPLLPLIGAHLGLRGSGFSFLLALVAAQNLGLVALFGRDLNLARTAARPSTGSWPRMLRELAWVLFGVALAGAVALALVAEVRANTPREAVRASLALLLAAAVGVAGGQLSGRDRYRHLSSGAAALAIVGAGTRVAALALPDYTLVVTTAIAAAIAVAAGSLPERARPGWQIGSLIGAAGAALVVAGSAIGTATATVRAAVTPVPWAADLLGYLDRVRTTSWQVLLAAVLLTVLAVAAAPARYRIDAAVTGMLFVALAASGTGHLGWWAVPLVAAVTSTAATFAALYATEGRSAMLRSTSAALLGAYAVGTSLARPELTAAVCGMLALVAATTTITTSGWPDSFGPYADRVADSAGGAAAFTLPIAVGTFSWLGGAQSGTLLPMTLLATAVGVLGAALSQTAARMPRTASAAGALAAAVGCIALGLVVDGTAAVDIALGVLLLAAALASAASRAFEAAPGVRCPVSVDGEIDRPGFTGPPVAARAGPDDPRRGARHRGHDPRVGPPALRRRTWHRSGHHNRHGVRGLPRRARAARGVATRPPVWRRRRGRGDRPGHRRCRGGRSGSYGRRGHPVLGGRPGRLAGEGHRLGALRVAGAGQPAVGRGGRLGVGGGPERRRRRVSGAGAGRPRRAGRARPALVESHRDSGLPGVRHRRRRGPGRFRQPGRGGTSTTGLRRDPGVLRGRRRRGCSWPDRGGTQRHCGGRRRGGRDRAHQDSVGAGAPARGVAGGRHGRGRVAARRARGRRHDRGGRRGHHHRCPGRGADAGRIRGPRPGRVAGRPGPLGCGARVRGSVSRP